MAYTFKDDGSALTYYREYNKEVGTGDKTLVGNWVEERALRDSIKTGRYALWANPDPDPKAAQATFTKFTTRPDTLDTYSRTVVHGDHVPPAEWITSNQVIDPGYAKYKNPDTGVRTALMEKRAQELAAATAAPAETLPYQYYSTTRQDFVAKDLPPAAELGRRVMMTQNMDDIKGAGDGLWRKEHDMVARHLGREAGEDDPKNMSSKPYYNTTSGGLGKNATFSTPITECLKPGEELGQTTDKFYKPE